MRICYTTSAFEGVAYALGLCSYMMQSSMVSVSFSLRCLWIYVYAGESAHSEPVHTHTNLHTFVYIRIHIRIHPCTSAYSSAYIHVHLRIQSGLDRGAGGSRRGHLLVEFLAHQAHDVIVFLPALTHTRV
jgi:hypothetical protein